MASDGQVAELKSQMTPILGRELDAQVLRHVIANSSLDTAIMWVFENQEQVMLLEEMAASGELEEAQAPAAIFPPGGFPAAVFAGAALDELPDPIQDQVVPAVNDLIAAANDLIAEAAAALPRVTLTMSADSTQIERCEFDGQPVAFTETEDLDYVSEPDSEAVMVVRDADEARTVIQCRSGDGELTFKLVQTDSQATEEAAAESAPEPAPAEAPSNEAPADPRLLQLKDHAAMMGLPARTDLVLEHILSSIGAAQGAAAGLDWMIENEEQVQKWAVLEETLELKQPEPRHGAYGSSMWGGKGGGFSFSSPFGGGKGGGGNGDVPSGLAGAMERAEKGAGGKGMPVPRFSFGGMPLLGKGGKGGRAAVPGAAGRATTHSGHQCSVCDKNPIVGVRHQKKFALTSNLIVSICDICKLNANPDDYEQHGNPAMHDGYNCDACNMKPIVGARYRKNDENFDVCEADFAKLEVAEQQNYRRIEQPGNSSHSAPQPPPPGLFGGASSGLFGGPVPPSISESARNLFGSSSAADSFEAFMRAKVDAEKDWSADSGGKGGGGPGRFSGFYSSYGKGGYSSYGKGGERGKGGGERRPVIHSGVSCDGCRMSPVIGTRYKKRGDNYDLCGECYNKLDDEEKAKYDAHELPKPSRYSEFSFARDIRTSRHRPSIQELSPPQAVHILRDCKRLKALLSKVNNTQVKARPSLLVARAGEAAFAIHQSDQPERAIEVRFIKDSKSMWFPATAVCQCPDMLLCATCSNQCTHIASTDPAADVTIIESPDSSIDECVRATRRVLALWSSNPGTTQQMQQIGLLPALEAVLKRQQEDDMAPVIAVAKMAVQKLARLDESSKIVSFELVCRSLSSEASAAVCIQRAFKKHAAARTAAVECDQAAAAEDAPAEAEQEEAAAASVTWACNTGTQTVPYSEQITTQLEQAYHDKEEVEFALQKHEYRIDWTTMEQVNVKTGVRRAVTRSPTAAAKAPTSPLIVEIAKTAVFPLLRLAAEDAEHVLVADAPSWLQPYLSGEAELPLQLRCSTGELVQPLGSVQVFVPVESFFIPMFDPAQPQRRILQHTAVSPIQRLRPADKVTVAVSANRFSADLAEIQSEDNTKKGTVLVAKDDGSYLVELDTIKLKVKLADSPEAAAAEEESNLNQVTVGPDDIQLLHPPVVQEITQSILSHNSDQLKELLAAAADTDLQLDRAGEGCRSALLVAAECCAPVEVVEQLLAVCDLDSCSMHMLLAAARNNHLGLIDFLLQHDVALPAGVVYTNSCLRTALAKCCGGPFMSSPPSGVLEPWEAASSLAAAVLRALIYRHSCAQPLSKAERGILSAIEDILSLPKIDVLAVGMPAEQLLSLVVDLLHSSPSRVHVLQALRMTELLIESNMRVAHVMVRNGTVAAIQSLRSRMQSSGGTPRSPNAYSASAQVPSFDETLARLQEKLEEKLSILGEHDNLATVRAETLGDLEERLFAGDPNALEDLAFEICENGLFAHELQQSNVISALLSFLSVTAADLNSCATPLGRSKHRGTLKEWLGASWEINGPTGIDVPEVSAAVAQSRFNRLRAAFKLNESPQHLKCLLKMLHQVVGMGEQLPIFTYNNPAFESSAHKNLRALVAPVNVELSSIDGGLMGTYQIEPLAKVEAVRKLILSSAPVNSPSTAPYRAFCQQLVGCTILARIQLHADKAFAYWEANVEACTFVNEIPVHSLKLLPRVEDASEDAASTPLRSNIQVVLAALEYRILVHSSCAVDDEDADSSMEEDLDEEQSYSVRINLASAAEQPAQFSVYIIKPEWYDVKDFWQAIRHNLTKSLLAGGFSWQDRGWTDERECVTFCNIGIVEKFKGCVAKNLSKEQAEQLVDRLRDVVQSEAEECESEAETHEEQVYDRISTKVAKALRWAEDLNGISERIYPDRGWEDHTDMKQSCVGGWKASGEGCVARGQTVDEADTLVGLLAASNLVATYKEDAFELCYKQRQRARLREVSLPTRAQRVGVKDNEATKAATVLAADEMTGLCAVVYDNGLVEKSIELPRLVRSDISAPQRYGRSRRAPKGPAPITRQMSVMNRYVEKIDSRGEAMQVEDGVSISAGRINQSKDGLLTHVGVFVAVEPEPPAEWATAELPMQLTVAYSLGNGTSQVILPSDQMTVWQALQKVKDTMMRHNPEEELSLDAQKERDPLDQLLAPSEEMSTREHKYQVLLRAKEQALRGPPQALRQQLKFDISVKTNTDADSPVRKFNPNLKADKRPRWTPEEVQQMFREQLPTLTKKGLIDEMQSLANPEWLKEHGLTSSTKKTLKRVSVPALIDKYRYLCDVPLLAPPKVHIALGDITAIDELYDIDRAALEAILLIDTLHQELHDVLPTTDPAWHDAKLSGLLAQQLDDPMSVLTGALPDWCFVLVCSAPCVFEVDLRKKLFELSAFGVSETVARIQSKALADLITKHKKMIASDDMEVMMAGVQLEEDIKYLSIGKQQEDVATAAVDLEDGPGMLDFAEKLMELTCKTHRPLSVQFECGFGDGLTRSFFGNVARELTSRSQNDELPMWISDGMELEAAQHKLDAAQHKLEQTEAKPVFHMYDYLTSRTLLPCMLMAPSSNVLARFRFLGRLLAKACRNKSIVPLPLDPAIFAVLCEENPRQIVKAFSAPNPESRLGYEQKKVKTSKGPFTRYDILNVFIVICDEIEALDSSSAQCSAADRKAHTEEVANRKVSDAPGGWLATIPRAFEWFLEHSEKTTRDVLSMITVDDDITCRNWLDLVGLENDPTLRDFGEVTVDNVSNFTSLLLRAVGGAVMPQLQALRDGIEDVLPVSSLEKFYPTELKQLFCGQNIIGWTKKKLLEETFEFFPNDGVQYGSSDQGIQALASVLEDFNNEQQGQFLEFVTGVARLAPGQDLKLGVLPQKPVMPFSRNCAPFRLSLCDYFNEALKPDALGWSQPDTDFSLPVRNAWDSARMAALNCYPELAHSGGIADSRNGQANSPSAAEKVTAAGDETAGDDVQKPVAVEDVAAMGEELVPPTLQRMGSVASRVAQGLLHESDAQGVIIGEWSSMHTTEKIHISITGKMIRFEEEGRGTTICVGQIETDGVIRGSVIQRGEDKGGVFQFKPKLDAAESPCQFEYQGTISLESEATENQISITIFPTEKVASDARFKYAKALLRFYLLLSFQHMVSGGYVH